MSFTLFAVALFAVIVAFFTAAFALHSLVRSPAIVFFMRVFRGVSGKPLDVSGAVVHSCTDVGSKEGTGSSLGSGSCSRGEELLLGITTTE